MFVSQEDEGFSRLNAFVLSVFVGGAAVAAGVKMLTAHLGLSRNSRYHPDYPNIINYKYW